VAYVAYAASVLLLAMVLATSCRKGTLPELESIFCYLRVHTLVS
jgi:hypothetical protein